MIRTQIQLTEHQARALRVLAAQRGLSMAGLIRQAVDYLIGEMDEDVSTERRQRAIALTGRFRSGVTDLSSQHDLYLTEAFDS